MRWRWVPGCLAVGSIALLIAGVTTASFFVVGPSEASVEARWVRAAGFSPLAAYPPRDRNAVALRLEALAAQLGMEIADEGRTQLTNAARARWDELKPEIRAYFAALRVPSPALAPPPAALEAFLDDAEPILREVRETLHAADPPRWQLHLERGMDNEIPNLLVHLYLHRLLVVVAGESARAGDWEASVVWLTAADRMRAAIAEDPLVMQQLLAIGELGSELTLLRALERPPAWRDRLAAIDPRAPMERALRVDGWVLAYATRTRQLERKIKTFPGGHLLLRVMAPHFNAQLFDSVEGAIAKLRQSDLRGFDGERFNREQLDRIPRWNTIARRLLPNYLDSPARAARSRLDVELTEQVIAAREAIAAGGTAALAGLPSRRPSRVRGFVWVYERRPDRLTIRANGDLPTAAKSAPPLEFHLPL